MCTPGWSHIPPLKRQHLREYWVFWAALEGCLTCVQYFLREDGMSPYNSSSSGSLTILDFAQWGEQLGNEGAFAMKVFLRTQWPQLRYRSRTSPTCVPWLSHAPPLAQRHRAEHFLFQAALQGCLECVQCLLTDGGLDIYNLSFSKQNSVLDFAKYAEEQHVTGARDVVDYLMHEMTSSAQYEEGLETGEVSPCSSERTRFSLSPEWWAISSLSVPIACLSPPPPSSLLLD